MRKSILAVFDAKAQAFTTPFFHSTPESAQREFQEAVNDPKTDFNRWPEDYTLMHVGDYDHETGVITPVDPPLGVAAAATLIRPMDHFQNLVDAGKAVVDEEERKLQEVK